VRYANETVLTRITHLKDCYAFISPIDLVANYERMYQTYDPSRPIEDLFKQMQDGWAYAQAGQQPYGKQQIINIAYVLVLNTGLFSYACKEWEKQDILDKNWENLTSTVCIINRHKQHKQPATKQLSMQSATYKTR
jgi:hypothetical protein